MNNTDIPPARQEYTLEEITSEGKAELFAAFESAYRRWLGERMNNWERIRPSLVLELPIEAFRYIDEKVIPEIIESPNFNRYKGDLERACAAAKHLAPRYDVGMGIAKKGLWTSFIFSLYGTATHDIISIRNEERRLTFPLGTMRRNDIYGKKVLLFDNDAVTGNTIRTAAEHLSRAGARPIDALLIYACTELKPEYYVEVKSQFKNNPSVLGERDGVVVIDTRSEVRPHVRKLMTLDRDYEPRPELLSDLAKKLGVNYEPKA